MSSNIALLEHHSHPSNKLPKRTRKGSPPSNHLISWSLFIWLVGVVRQYTANTSIAYAWISPSSLHLISLRAESVTTRTMGATFSSFNHGQHRHANQNDVHDNTRESINSNNHEPHVGDSIIDRNRHNHSQADTVDTASTEDWNKVCDRFKKQLLDESYLVYPIRGSTIEAADQYPCDNSSDKNPRPRLMPGTHKHLGGAYDPTDGCIYGVPANSRSVMCLYPSEDKKSYEMKTIPLPKEIQEIRMKWLRGKL